MSDLISTLLSALRLQTNVFHNAQYCGVWGVDTSGSGHASFHIVTQGKCVLDTDHMKAVPLEAGDMVIFPRDASHCIRDCASGDVEANTVESIPFGEVFGTGLVCGYFQFDVPGLNPLLNSLPDELVVRAAEANWQDNIGPLLTVLLRESTQTIDGTAVTLNRLSEALFVIILREWLRSENNQLGMAAVLSDARIVKALQALYANADNEWTVELLAQKAAMSRSAFAARFNELMGESPIAHMRRWRMQSASQWLTEDNLSVAQVADRCGYATEAAFAKAFKRETGLSPGAVRKGAGLVTAG